MKKLIAALAAVVVIAVIALLAVNAHMTLGLRNIVSIRLTASESGHTVSITDPDKIEEIRRELNAARWEKRGQAETDVCAYTLEMTMKNGETRTLTLAEFVLIRDGVLWVIADDCGVNTQIFEKYFRLGQIGSEDE